MYVLEKKRISTLKSYMKQVQNLYRTIFVYRIEKSKLTELFERGMILVRWARRWEQDTEKVGFVYEVTYGYKD